MTVVEFTQEKVEPRRMVGTLGILRCAQNDGENNSKTALWLAESFCGFGVCD